MKQHQPAAMTTYSSDSIRDRDQDSHSVFIPSCNLVQTYMFDRHGKPVLKYCASVSQFVGGELVSSGTTGCLTCQTCLLAAPEHSVYSIGAVAQAPLLAANNSVIAQILA